MITQITGKFKKSFYCESLFFKEKGQDYYLIFSTRSFHLIKISKKLWDDIDSDIETIQDLSLMNNLIKKKFLVPVRSNETNIILNENLAFKNNNKNLYISLQPSGQCTLDCNSCGQSQQDISFNNKTQANILNHIYKKMASKKFSTLRISWLGREPLLAKKIISSLSEKLKLIAKEFTADYYATLSTNGLLLNSQTIKKIIKANIKEVEIILDGNKAPYENKKPFKEETSNFNIILNNIKKLIEIGKGSIKVSIRSNIDSSNIKVPPVLIDALVKANLQQHVDLYFAPVHSCGKNAHKIGLTKKKFAEKEIDWLTRMQDEGFKVKLLPSRKKRACMAVSIDDELIDPYGNVFNCTQVSLTNNIPENKYKLGNVNNNLPFSIKKRSKLENFYNEKILKKFDCLKCNILPVCAGACPKLWREGFSPCPSIRFNLKNRMILYHIDNETN